MTEQEESIAWIRTEPTIDGSHYIVTVSFTDDFSFTVTPTRATAYTVALLAAVADAEYDHAVLRLAQERLKLDFSTAYLLVRDLRGERPERKAAGLAFEPLVSAEQNVPLVNIKNMTTGDYYTQWSPASCRRHALHVLEAPAAADLDATFYRILRSSVGTEEHVARNVIDDLQHYRLEWEVSDQ